MAKPVDHATFCDAVSVIVGKDELHAQIAGRGGLVFAGNLCQVVLVLAPGERLNPTACVGLVYILGFDVKAHLPDIRECHRHDAGHVAALIQQRGCVRARHQKLLRGERLDVDAALLHLCANLHRHHGRGHAVRAGDVPLADDFGLALLLFQLIQSENQFFDGRDVEGDRLGIGFFLPAPHAGAVLLHQSVMESVVKDEKAVVLLVENVVAGVRDLLGALHVFCRHGLEAHRLVTASERPQQGWEHPLHGVLHVARDDGRLALNLVPVWLAHVGAHAIIALLLDDPVHVA